MRESGSEAGSGGRSIDIGGGRQIFLECAGEGTPTVILESGIHDSSDYWVNIQPNPPAIGPDVFAGSPNTPGSAGTTGRAR